MKHNPSPRFFSFAALAVSGLLCATQDSSAQITLADGNSSMDVFLNSSAGAANWTVDGQDQLNQQWFWYRVGTSGFAAPINTISAATVLYNDANTLVASYANASFTLTITYVLTGGGPGMSDVLESISVQNNTGGTLDFHLFQYSDFDLLGTPGGDSVTIDGAGSGYDFVFQSKGPTQIQEAITSPMADRAEAGIAFDTINNFNTIAGYDLNNNLSAGPGNVTWSLQWNASIAAGGNFDVFKDKKLSLVPIPEPSSLALMALGLGAWGFARRRQKA